MQPSLYISTVLHNTIKTHVFIILEQEERTLKNTSARHVLDMMWNSLILNNSSICPPFSAS